MTIVAAHEDGKADYSAEVGALASAGGDILVVAGYLDQGGLGIIQAALDTGAFDTFGLPGGMIGDSCRKRWLRHGRLLRPDRRLRQRKVRRLADASQSTGFDGTSPYAAESYDAAALIMLAMQAADSTDPADYGAKSWMLPTHPAK